MKTKSTSALLILMATIILFSSCAESYIISSGATDNKPLLFNNEYETKKLNEIAVEGKAIFGIPSFASNNQHNRKYGMLFTFNGVQLGKTPRILPIATMLLYSFSFGTLLSGAVGRKEVKYNPNSYYVDVDTKTNYKLPLGVSMILTLPISGALNNLTWPNAAASGASQTINFRLVDENPNIDVFFYPKYSINRTFGIWNQKANVKANLTGGILKLKSGK